MYFLQIFMCNVEKTVILRFQISMYFWKTSKAVKLQKKTTKLQVTVTVQSYKLQ